jgi:putative peptidoglycan lipid II flippase
MNICFLMFTPLQHAGLALAVGLGACLNATLLWVTLQKAGAFQPQAGWVVFLIKLLIAVTVMALVLYAAATWSGDWLAMPTLNRMLHLAGIVVLGMTVYFSALALLGFRPGDFMKRVAK